MFWLAQAAAREEGMAGAAFDARFLAGLRSLLQSHIDGQREYHRNNVHTLHTVDKRLQRAGLTLFILTLFACGAHLFIHSAWLTLLSAVLPAFGAAFSGIRSHGEFEISTKRSEAASENLERLANELRGLEKPNSKNLGAVAESAADLMIEEALSWRLVSESRPLELSG